MINQRRLCVRGILLGASTAALLAFADTPAAAGSDPASPTADLECSLTFTVDINPGLFPGEPRHFADTTHGLTGTASCTGTVDGQTVTGTGAFAQYVASFGSCASSSGSGEFVLQLPTTGGLKTVTGPFTFTNPGAPGPSVITGDLTGTATVLSVNQGDCVTTPITNVTVRFDVHVS